jgi:YidC/Oxa1 family membrane protein insertase
LRQLFDLFLPIHTVWWAVFGQSISWGLGHLYLLLAANPLIGAIGAYGMAIVLLTIVIKVLLAPLFQLQLFLSKRSIDQQRALAPELAQLRKEHKGNPQKQQAAMMELYREKGVNPLSNLTGCLPAFLQFPILTALYYVFFGNAQHGTFADHFLFIPHLNATPSQHPLIPGLPIPTLVYLVIPILAAATTFVQSRMMQQPPNPMASEQEQQAQQMTQTMQVMMPLMITYFAFVTPAGLGLYWFVSNCFAIIQQYLVNGWGGLRRDKAPASPTPPAPAAPATASAPANASLKRTRKPRK